MTYDAIVVGARCAGSPTAMLLARKGHRVLLLDKAAFPSDTLSTHYIHQPGVACLDRWGVLPEIAGSGCPPIRSLVLDVGPFALQGTPPPAGDVADAYSVPAHRPGPRARPRRRRGRRGAAGALRRRGARVRGRARGGRPRPGPGRRRHRHRAGAHRDRRGRPELHRGARRQRPEVQRPGRAHVRLLRLLERRRGRGRGAVRAPRQHDRHRADERRSGRGGRPLAERRVPPGSLRHRGPLPRRARARSGPGRARPLRHAHRPLPRADYERRRNELSADGFESTIGFARLQPPPPERQQLLGALLGDQEQADRLFGTFAGTVSTAEFFAPDNLARILQTSDVVGVQTG
jgi:choline dehydrogenase-like flavoprotein